MLDEEFVKEVDSQVERYLMINNVHYVERNSKKWFRCVYPDHNDSNPSMVRIPGKNILKCFGCGKTLSIVQAFDIFHPSDRNLTYADKIKAIAEELGMQVPDDKYSDPKYIEQMRAAYADFEQLALRGKSKIKLSVRKYLEGKRIPINYTEIGYIPDYNAYEYYMLDKYPKEMLDHLSLLGGFRFGEDSLLFLLRDESGNVVASASRYCGSDANAPKYINASNSTLYNKSQMLFGMHNVKHADTVVLVEGYSDAAVAQINGLRNTLALCGTQLSKQHMAWLKEHVRKGIVLALDGDDAGQQGMIEIAAKYFMDPQLRLQIAFVALPDGKDPDDVIISSGVGALFKNVIDRIKISDSILQARGASTDERDEFLAEIMMNAEQSTAQRYLRTYAQLRKYSYRKAAEHVSGIIMKILSEQKSEYIEMSQHWQHAAEEIDAMIDKYVNLNYWNAQNGSGRVDARSGR